MDITRCKCGSYDLKVTDSRPKYGSIWRTRVCQNCGQRYFTIETERSEAIEVDRTDVLLSKKIVEAYKELKVLLNALEKEG